MPKKPLKRVEYQKYLRTRLEAESRRLFGLTENLTLVGEEDIVLQHEFRIDFLFEKRDATISLLGIFSYFKKYNLAEFKSVNDPLDLVLLPKYLGQLFWWFFSKKQEAKEKKDADIQHQDVTLTFITVATPRNVLSMLENIRDDIKLTTLDNGHYRWQVMSIEVHLLVINELTVKRENYGWLSFAEGRKYAEYKAKLAEEMAKDDATYQVYFELLIELEKEGKERMAYEVIRRFISEMPLEKQVGLFMWPEEEGETRMANVIQRYLSEIPLEKQVELFMGLEREGETRMAEAVKHLFQKMPASEKQELLEELQQIISELPAESGNA